MMDPTWHNCPFQLAPAVLAGFRSQSHFFEAKAIFSKPKAWSPVVPNSSPTTPGYLQRLLHGWPPGTPRAGQCGLRQRSSWLGLQHRDLCQDLVCKEWHGPLAGSICGSKVTLDVAKVCKSAKIEMMIDGYILLHIVTICYYLLLLMLLSMKYYMLGPARQY